MTGWITRLLPPTAPPLRRIPQALLQAGLCGIVIGPILGLFFGWSGPIRAAVIGGMYALLYYTFCALPAGYVRRHLANKSSARANLAAGLLSLIGIVLIFVVILAILGEFRTSIQAIQIPIVLIMFALAWGQVVSTRQFVEAEKQLANARADTRVLQSRMNPHFFFNTLNTISALIPDDPAAAQRMLGLMADMGQYVFTGADSEVVPLARELEFARSYLEIEKVRFGNRLACELSGTANTDGLSIPVFTLQPLIENAIRYGISKRMEGGRVVVRLTREGRRFSIMVENDVEDPVIEKDFFQAGHALHNIRERLRLIYGGQASIEVRSPRPYVISVRIEAPVKPVKSGANTNDSMHHR
jgi:LytS/YehU family sensor histidine kinase